LALTGGQCGLGERDDRLQLSPRFRPVSRASTANVGRDHWRTPNAIDPAFPDADGRVIWTRFSDAFSLTRRRLIPRCTANAACIGERRSAPNKKATS